jgi:hypothetical protein
MEHLPFDSQWVAYYPNFHRFYNLFEDNLPSSAHLAYLDALCISSKHLGNQDRGFSLVKIAEPGDGKSVAARQFEGLPNVNFDMHISKSGCLEKYFGKYLVKLGTGYVPRGVKRLKDGGFDASEAVDYIHMHTSMITEAESLTSMHEGSLGGLIHLLDPLIEEGKVSYNDTYNGEYSGGYGERRLSYNLSMGLTPRGFRKFIPFDTFATRVAIAYYRSLDCERADIQRKIEQGTLVKEPNLQNEVKQFIYSRLRPDETKEVTFSRDAVAQLRTLTEVLISMRTSFVGYPVVGKRDAKIARQLAASIALLENRTEATIQDVSVAIALMRSSNASYYDIKLEDNSTYRSWVYTASKAHFLASLSYLAGVDPAAHLSRFADFEGRQLYSSKVIEEVLRDLGLKQVRAA